MGNASGALFRMLYAKEDVWGTPPAVKHRILPIRSETLEGGVGLLESDELSGNRMFEEPTQGNFNAAGDVNVQWSADAHMFMLSAFLGGHHNSVLQTVALNKDFNPWIPADVGNERYKDKDGSVTDDPLKAFYAGLDPGSAPTATGAGATLAEAIADVDTIVEYKYRHFMEQLKASATDLPTFTVEKGFLNVGTQGYFIPILGCSVNRLTFEAAPEAFITGVVGMLGREEGEPKESSAVVAADIVNETHKGFNSFAGTIVANAAVQSVITRATLTLENNLTQENVVASQRAGARFLGRVRVSGSLEALFGNGTLYSRYRKFQDTDLVLSFKDSDAAQRNSLDPTATWDTAEYYNDPEVRLTIPAMKFSGATPRVGGEGPINLPLEFSAFRNSGTDAQIRAIVVNGKADLAANAA